MEILVGFFSVPPFHRSSPYLLLCVFMHEHELFTVKRKEYALQISAGCHSFNTLQNTLQFNKAH